MASTSEVLRCPNCSAVVAEQSQACGSCEASFEGPLAWKPKVDGAKDADVPLPQTSFVVAEGFFLGMLFEVGAYVWSRIAGSDRPIGTVVLWQLFGLANGNWLVFIAIAILARCTWLAKLRLPASRTSRGLFRAAAVLCCAQFIALLLIGPIYSIIFAPFTLGVAFILTVVANARVILGVVRR